MKEIILLQVQIVSSKPLLGVGSTLVTMESLSSVGSFIVARQLLILQLGHVNDFLDTRN